MQNQTFGTMCIRIPNLIRRSMRHVSVHLIDRRRKKIVIAMSNLELNLMTTFSYSLFAFLISNHVTKLLLCLLLNSFPR